MVSGTWSQPRYLQSGSGRGFKGPQEPSAQRRADDPDEQDAKGLFRGRNASIGTGDYYRATIDINQPI